MLHTWRSSSGKGPKASLKELKNAFRDSGRTDLVNKVQEMYDDGKLNIVYTIIKFCLLTQLQLTILH